MLETPAENTYIKVEDYISESSEKDREAIATARQEFKDQIADLKKSFQRERIRFIEVIGIFIALFTFLGVNVQIFSRLKDLSSAMWFMLVMGGVTITILIVIELIVENPDGPKGLRWHIRIWRFLTSKLFLLILLAIAQITVGLYFSNKNKIQLNTETSSIQVEANIKSDNVVNTSIKTNREK